MAEAPPKVVPQRKVLIADDDPSILNLIGIVLEGEGRYRLFKARDGEETLQMALREAPDLILLDIGMPLRDGIEVCNILKGDALTARIKIIMLTAFTEESTRKRAEAAGADSYMTKPFSPMALLQKVGEALV